MIATYVKCPACGYGLDKSLPPVSTWPCEADPQAVPLRCKHAADAAAHKVWSGELYHTADGQRFVPQKRKAILAADKDEEVPEGTPGARVRMVLDLDATLAGEPVLPPEKIVHVHRYCFQCGHKWHENVK